MADLTNAQVAQHLRRQAQQLLNTADVLDGGVNRGGVAAVNLSQPKGFSPPLHVGPLTPDAIKALVRTSGHRTQDVAGKYGVTLDEVNALLTPANDLKIGFAGWIKIISEDKAQGPEVTA